MTSAVDLIRGTTPSTRAGAGRAAGWRCPPEGERQRHPEKADGREGHCTWPDHCSRPSQPLAQSLRSASAPEGPERSGGGAERLAAVRIARTTLPGDGLGPARPGPNLPPPPLVDKHLWEVGEAVAPAGSPHRDCATAPRFPRLPQLHFLPNLNPCKKVESPSRCAMRPSIPTGRVPFRRPAASFESAPLLPEGSLSDKTLHRSSPPHTEHIFPPTDARCPHLGTVPPAASPAPQGARSSFA